MADAPLDPIQLAPRVVVFDYGEVISLAPSEADRAALVARAGADDDAFWPAYWRHREGLDQGTRSIADYWSSVSDDLGLGLSAADAHELWAIDHRSWLSVDPGTLAVIEALRAGGTRTALLSNAGADFSGWLRSGSFGPLFERVFVSGELGLVKPGPDIYRHVIEELGIEASDLVFIDNKAENVDGAIAVGGTGHTFVGADDLEAWLRGLAA